ncbi:MAG TPA: hypothetical protein VNA21_15965 [Steroidobacteraceae bacterium]|nr:hypothetical protein [Steroidobacteraceae bacterium]
MDEITITGLHQQRSDEPIRPWVAIGSQLLKMARRTCPFITRQYKEIVGDPLYDPNRNTRIQSVLWDEKRLPKFGVPVAGGPVALK